MKVVLQKDLLERSKTIFENASKEYDIEFLITNPLDEKAMFQYHQMGAKCFIIGAEAYSTDFYKALSNDSLIIRYGVGYNSVPLDICKKRNIKVGYTPGTLTESVAEHTIALLLSVTRKIPQLHNSMISGEWKGSAGIELAGKTIAVLGFGAIGRAVAKIAKYGFGMNVNAYDIRNIENTELVDLFSNDFGKVVKNADVVTLHMASTAETAEFINRERIAKMRDGAILINTARGGLVNESDLYAALTTGKISAAALDVFNNEPYKPADKAAEADESERESGDLANNAAQLEAFGKTAKLFSDEKEAKKTISSDASGQEFIQTGRKSIDLRNLPNVVLTPHCGSNTLEANNKMANMCVKNILAYRDAPDKIILIPELRG